MKRTGDGGAFFFETPVRPASRATIHSSYLAIDGANNYGDNYLGTHLRALISPFLDAAQKKGPGNLAQQANECLEFSAANGPYVADLYLNSVLPLAAAVPPGIPAAIFQAHAVTQTAISHFHLVAFDAAARGALSFLAGDVPTATSLVLDALAAIDDLLAVMRAGEGTGSWVGLYANEYWTWVVGSRAYLTYLAHVLAGETSAQPPATRYPDYDFMQYECQRECSLPCACAFIRTHRSIALLLAVH